MLDREVVERLGELLAKATPGEWRTAYRKGHKGYAQEVFDANNEVIATLAWHPVKLTATTTTTDREANAELITAAVNALPELLCVYRMWMDAPVLDVWGGYDEYGITFRAESEAGELAAFQRSGLAGQAVRLVRDGEPGEGS